MKFGLSMAIVLAAGLLPAAAPADGRPFRATGDRYARLQLARGYSLDETVSGVRQRYPGKVLSADTIDQGGSPVHRIRILNDEGRVRGLRFDGNTGKPLPRPDQRRPRNGDTGTSLPRPDQRRPRNGNTGKSQPRSDQRRPRR